MPVPSASELARLRTDYQSWATERAELHRVVNTPDNEGGYVSGDQIVWEGMISRRPSSESRRSAGELGIGGIEESRNYWLITLPVDVEIKHYDHIIASGRTFEIQGTIDRSIQITQYVLATEMQ